jgi:hypothetical protein
MADSEPKSAFELAMERLRRKDDEEGVVHRQLSDAQKAEIAEVRNVFEARLAQLEVMHRSGLARTFDPAEREQQENGYRRERERVTAERDDRIERIRKGSDAS